MRRVRIYTSFFSILGGTLALAAIFELPGDPSRLIVFCFLAVLAELLSVELFSTSRASRVSVAGIISIAVVMIYGPMGGAVLGATVGLTTIYTTSKNGAETNGGRASWLERGFFNLGMLVISSALAGSVYLLAGGVVGVPGRLTNLPALVAATIVNELVNIVILVGVLTLQTGRPPLQIWQQNIAWGMPLSIIGSVAGGWALAMAYDMYQSLGLLVFLLPVLATSYSFRLYVQHTKKYVTRLERLNRTLDDANLGLLETLGAVIDAYDVYTFGHSAQVAVYVEAIAEKMQIPPDQQATFVKAALVHDIGKVGITSTIIGKLGPLSEEEYRLVQRHPIIGADILRRTAGLQDLVPLVRHHHERWDGSGYPAGLAGEEIPLGARIIALADSVDAMISARPYRKVQTIEDVSKEMVQCSAVQFDPQVVTAFQQVLQEKGPAFFIDSRTHIDETAADNSGSAMTRWSQHLKRSVAVD